MFAATLLIILALLGATWWLMRTRGASAAVGRGKAGRPVVKASTAYHAVSIRYESIACAAARAMDGRRFLASAAPRLPLADCTARECRCRFIHHADRRSGRDRRSPFAPAGSFGPTGAFEREKRSGKERRQSDEYF